MINRELTEREKEILEMIRPTTFRDIVDAVRKDIEQSKYDAKRELRNLHNGVTNGTVKRVMNGVVCTTNGREGANNIGEKACGVLI
jgi:hypothetical protein